MDNIFIERLWRSLKYEAVYLHEMTDGFVARRVIGDWLSFYNNERPHSSLDDKTPSEAYWSGRQEKMAATRIYLNFTAKLSRNVGLAQFSRHGEWGA